MNEVIPDLFYSTSFGTFFAGFLVGGVIYGAAVWELTTKYYDAVIRSSHDPR